jgi:hypothetical protein
LAVQSRGTHLTTVTTKRVSTLKQAVPNLQRIAMLWSPDDLGTSRVTVNEVPDGAAKPGLIR